MHQALTPVAESKVSDLAQRYGISVDAVRTMLYAVNNGRGSMAQFNIPELGGGGQWMRGGMTMVGDMFNHGLKSRVDGLCQELSTLLAEHQVFPPIESSGGGFGSSQGGSQLGGSQQGGSWWPSDLGSPSSSGGQNGSQYAYFPGTRRLAVLVGGRLSVYDTLDHSIGGVQQQQGGGPGSLEFTSQYGTFTAASLPLVDPRPADPAPAQPSPSYDRPQNNQPQNNQSQNAQPQNAPAQNTGSSASRVVGGDLAEITGAIEALASLHSKGILTDDEFFTKKADLLNRL